MSDSMEVLDCGFFEAVVDGEWEDDVVIVKMNIPILEVKSKGGWFKRKTLYLSCCGCQGDAVRSELGRLEIPFVEIENGRNRPRIVEEPMNRWIGNYKE